MSVPLSRRAVLGALAASAAGLLAGCRAGPGPGPDAGPTPTRPSPPPDPQAADLAAERRLLAAYDATVRRHPTLRPRLAPLRADHAAHVAALEAILGLTPSPVPTGGTAPTVPAPAVPGTPAGALAALRAAERGAAAARTAACLTAAADRAPVLASIAACEATHEVLLG